MAGLPIPALTVPMTDVELLKQIMAQREMSNLAKQIGQRSITYHPDLDRIANAPTVTPMAEPVAPTTTGQPITEELKNIINKPQIAPNNKLIQELANKPTTTPPAEDVVGKIPQYYKSEDLTEDPKKHKSAEEFVKGQGKLFKDELSQLRDKYDNMGIDLSAFGDIERGIELSKIEVPKDQRGQGKARQAMEELVKLAEDNGTRITLTPTNEFGASKKRLTDFYKEYGFVENKGKNKDFSTRNTMYRNPKTKQQLTDIYNKAQGKVEGIKFGKKTGDPAVDITTSEEPYEGGWDEAYQGTRPKTLKEYAEKSKKKFGEVIQMSPDEYISSVERIPGGKPDKGAMNSLRKGVEDGKEINMPYIEYSNGKVENQEGRHRAYLAKELGMEKIPVLVVRKVEGGVKDKLKSRKPK